MNAKAEKSGQAIDHAIWVIVIAVILGGAWANTYYASVTLVYRALAGVAIAGVALAIALQSTQGKAAWELAKEARVEVRKVVWPSREETTQTTLIVVVVVFLVGLMLWGLDSGLSWGVHALIG